MIVIVLGNKWCWLGLSEVEAEEASLVSGHDYGFRRAVVVEEDGLRRYHCLFDAGEASAVEVEVAVVGALVCVGARWAGLRGWQRAGGAFVAPPVVRPGQVLGRLRGWQRSGGVIVAPPVVPGRSRWWVLKSCWA